MTAVDARANSGKQWSRPMGCAVAFSNEAGEGVPPETRKIEPVTMITVHTRQAFFLPVETRSSVEAQELAFLIGLELQTAREQYERAVAAILAHRGGVRDVMVNDQQAVQVSAQFDVRGEHSGRFPQHYWTPGKLAAMPFAFGSIGY